MPKVRMRLTHCTAVAGSQCVCVGSTGAAEAAPKLLGYWHNDATDERTMELEYVSGVPHHQLCDELHQVKAYMAGLLQVCSAPTITEANVCHSLSSPVYTQALALLHEKARLVHRDIKPANIQADLLPNGGTS